MTLVLLMLYAGKVWYLRHPMTMLCTAAILHRPLRRSQTFWFLITLILAAANYYNWYLIDNHKYLITYWCLALYCSLLTASPDQAIQRSGRLLIGLCFLFAAVWKAISFDYLDGTFFHYSLLTDDRFSTVTTFFGGLAGEVFLKNHQAFKALLAYDSTLQTIQLQDTLQVLGVAKFLTWWTIIIEGLIAVAFLWPRDRLISRWRDWLLLIFLLSTYAVAPVIGFGWVLIAMGAAQCTSRFKNTRLLYMLAFFALQVYLMPWDTILSYLIGKG
jgi:hypothetical protein